MSHEDYQQMLAAQALSALDAEDARALEAHLASCAVCFSEMREWEETASFLALDSPPLEPSSKLRAQVLASVRAAGSDTRLDHEQTTDLAESVVGPGDSRVLAFARPQKAVWNSAQRFGAIAAVLALITLVISLVALWQQNRTTKAELARLSTEMRVAKEQLAREQALVALLTSPGARMMELAGTKAAPGARAMLAYDKSGHAMLMAKGLPSAPAGMAYQLWFIKDNKKMPGKVFATDASGNGMLEDEIPAVARDEAVFAITLEPETGVQVPTGDIYLLSAS